MNYDLTGCISDTPWAQREMDRIQRESRQKFLMNGFAMSVLEQKTTKNVVRCKKKPKLKDKKLF